MEDIKIIKNKALNIWEALFPILILIILLGYNVLVYGDDALSGSNQFILLLGAAVAGVVGVFNGISYRNMVDEIANNFNATAEALLILLLVGSLTGTWLLSGIIPTFIYGGLKILTPSIFLPVCTIVCALVSVATGSSWSTTGTVGVALLSIGTALGFSPGIVAGAIISGAYFGDKLSPLSDTTNLAPVMAGGELFSHIRYLSYTTVPTFIITLIVFSILGITSDTSGDANADTILATIEQNFNVSPWLMLVPIIVIGMITQRTKPIIALLVGSLLGGLFAVIFQPNVVARVAGAESMSSFAVAYKGVMNALTIDTNILPDGHEMGDLLSAGGMSGMLGTVWLIICAMVFGGVMEAIGALARISETLLSMAKSIFGLFASTVASCLVVNVTASDQYLSIVIPGKMFAKAYEDKGLAPENLSRTLEDSGTVTSVLIPWNTCGAFQSQTLGVSVADYFIYAVFNYISPFMTLLFAAFQIKIKKIAHK